METDISLAHNMKELRCGKSVEKLPIMLASLQRMVIGFLNVVQAAHLSFVPDGILDGLIELTQRGKRRLAGVALQRTRLRAVAEALLAVAPKPGGYTLAELTQRVHPIRPDKQLHYAARHASYDLAKLRGKALVERVEGSRRYRLRPYCIRILAGILVSRERVLKPVLAGLGKPRVGRPPKHGQPIDQPHQALQHELRSTFQTLGLAACG